MNNWNRDLTIRITDENENDVVGEIVIHGVEGEADERITLDEIKACAKYFGDQIGNASEMLGDDEYGMAFFLAFRAEAIQRGGELKVNMLDTIPIMHKWLTLEATMYLQEKMKKKWEINDESVDKLFGNNGDA